MLTLGYSPYAHPLSIKPFDDIFEKSQNFLGTLGIKDIDAAVFWGGTDIHPSIYGKEHHPYSGAGVAMSTRDMLEIKAMTHCRKNGIPMIGVCRGAQLMCAFAGGSLVQHCDGHTSEHDITYEKEPGVYRQLMATSSHHQMMDLRNVTHKLLAWSFKRQASYYDGETSHEQIPIDKEPEIVYFPEIKGLAIQGHPEWVENKHPFAMLCNSYIRQYLLEPEFAA